MERITQRTKTDCVRCCIAMVMCLSYEEVPDFVSAHGDLWASELNEWLNARGCGLLIFNPPAIFVPHWLPVIAICGGSKEPMTPGHAVVITHSDGVVDPSPDPLAVGEANTVYAIIQGSSNTRTPSV